MFLSVLHNLLHCISGGSKIGNCVTKIVLYTVWYIFAFFIQQYNLMVSVDFSLIDSDPKVSHLLAGIAMSFADEGRGL
jgi:hypothetical protein